MINRICGAFCFLAGIVLMGSDGEWFPWINLFGVIVFAGCAYFANKIREEL